MGISGQGMDKPHVALLVSTYQRPAHLERVLESIAVQKGVDGMFEVVVSDDGSTDRTAEVVDRFANSVDFPVLFTTHPHEGFQLAKCRNDGVRASQAEYIVFLDGDCLIPPDHLAIHLRHRRPGIAFVGYCCKLNRQISERLSVEDVRSGEFMRRVPRESLNSVRRMHMKSRFYNLIGHSSKPKLFGGNVGIWRRDYAQVNGYDENFRGWGCEDDDLRLRLRKSGVGICSIAKWTQAYHLWHPPAPSSPAIWREGDNIAYFMRTTRVARCENGLDLVIEPNCG
jgi:glycosyltransferase involved in cell wall biosynthesis